MLQPTRAHQWLKEPQHPAGSCGQMRPLSAGACPLTGTGLANRLTQNARGSSFLVRRWERFLAMSFHPRACKLIILRPADYFVY